MLFSLTLLLVFQLIGEVIVLLTGIPVPGPVVGMLLLFAALAVRGSAPRGLKQVSQALLRHLSLLFVPAGAGVMLHFERVRAEWLPIGGALVASTVLTLAATALTLHWLGGRGGAPAGGERP